VRKRLQSSSSKRQQFANSEHRDVPAGQKPHAMMREFLQLANFSLSRFRPGDSAKQQSEEGKRAELAAA